MNTSLLSKFLYCASLIVIGMSVVRWYFMFPDISQLAFGLNVALTILIGAYVHSAFRNVVNDIKVSNKIREKQIEELNEALDKAIDYTRELDDRIKDK